MRYVCFLEPRPFPSAPMFPNVAKARFYEWQGSPARAAHPPPDTRIQGDAAPRRLTEDAIRPRRAEGRSGAIKPSPARRRDAPGMAPRMAGRPG